jgi:hypothetical protein
VITATLVGDAAAVARLRAISDDANSGLARAIAKLGIELQRNVQHDKLSGQPLKLRSGSLRSSIELRMEQSGSTVSATVSSDLQYARAQEHGYIGTVLVRTSLRRVKEAFGRPIAEKAISVRAHGRRMNLPERSFLRSALGDMTSDIQDAIDGALRAAVTR